MKKYNYQQYQKDLGERIKQYRISMGLKQTDLQDISGVSVRSISRLEQGNPIELESFIKVLMALNLDDNLNLLIPDQTKRPSYYLKEEKNNKQRVRKKKETTTSFKWGDEQ